MYVSEDKYLCKVHTCIHFLNITLNTSKTKSKTKQTKTEDNRDH